MSMRIIAGSLKNREIKSPNTHKTHPMSDKMRGALFNILGDIEGLTFLDPFAGTGALSFEAISRGAKNALMIEKDKKAARTIKENIQSLDVNNVQLVEANASSWSDNNRDKKFNILVLDPPYEEVQIKLIQKLMERHINENGIVVLSSPREGQFSELLTCKVLETRDYGNANLCFIKT